MKYLISTIVLFCLSFSIFAQESIRPWMGIYIEENPKGVYVKDAVDDTPAKKAGLKKGDIILEVNQIKVTTTQGLIETVSSIGVGNIAKVRYLENGEKEKLTEMELVARPGVLDIIQKNLLDKKAPSFKAKILSGGKKKEFDLEKQKDRVTFIMFWATWCSACAQAQPVMAEFAKANKNIDVVALSTEDEKKIKKYVHLSIEAKKTNDAVLFIKPEGNSVAEDYFIPAFPLFIVLDKNQVVRKIDIGVGPKLLEMLELTKTLSQN